jgi:hypothetical protein
MVSFTLWLIYLQGKEPQELFRAMRRKRFLDSARIQTLTGWLSSPFPVTVSN